MRDAVADLELGDAGVHAGFLQDPLPAGDARVGGALGEVAEDRQRLAAGPAHRHPQLHRGEVLGLVDDDVAEAPEAGVDQPVRLVEQRDVGRRHVGLLSPPP